MVMLVWWYDSITIWWRAVLVMMDDLVDTYSISVTCCSYMTASGVMISRYDDVLLWSWWMIWWLHFLSPSQARLYMTMNDIMLWWCDDMMTWWYDNDFQAQIGSGFDASTSISWPVFTNAMHVNRMIPIFQHCHFLHGGMNRPTGGACGARPRLLAGGCRA